MFTLFGWLIYNVMQEKQLINYFHAQIIHITQCIRFHFNHLLSYWLAHFLPPANSISAGQLLCGGLFSADSLSNWCAAVALAHALQDNLTQKEQLLRVQLATSLGKPPVSLLQQCTNILSQVWPRQWAAGVTEMPNGYVCKGGRTL